MGWDAKPGPPPLSASVDKIMARLRVRQAGCVTGNGNGNARDGRAFVQTSERLLRRLRNQIRALAKCVPLRTYLRVRDVVKSIKASGKL